MENKLTSPYSMRIEVKDRNNFQRLYPYCLSRFIKLCIKNAIKNPSFFNDVYFNNKEV